MFARGIILAVGLALCTGCERAAIDPSDSFVGARTLPARSVLEKEVISISRGGGGPYGWPHVLSYEIRPDGDLVVSHTAVDGLRRKLVGEERFKLRPAAAAAARRALWRLRPITVRDGTQEATRPLGCTRHGSHDDGEILVAFRDDDNLARGLGVRMALFELPYVASCNNAHAKSARRLLAELLNMMPRSRVSAGFEKAVAD